MDFFNSYQDDTRAKEYAKLAFHNTYYLAFRDLPTIFKQYAYGNNALDFGCGTGRSTRFLKYHGYSTIGIDISNEMINQAQTLDPQGTYLIIKNEDYSVLPITSFDLILSAFTFDNIPLEKKQHFFTILAQMLNTHGILINLVSSPEMYTHEWASFSTKDYPINKNAKTGDIVSIITTDFNDRRPCYDVFCTDIDYKKMYEKTGLKILNTYKPLAQGNEPYNWVNETIIAPWSIYVLTKKG